MTAVIDNGGTVRITQAGEKCDSMHLGFIGDGGLLFMQSGDLEVTHGLGIGPGGSQFSSILTHTGGTIRTSTLLMGQEPIANSCPSEIVKFAFFDPGSGISCGFNSGSTTITNCNITNNGKSHASVALLGWATLAGGTALYLQGQASYAYVTGGTANTAYGIDAWCETDGGTIVKGYGTSHWISNTSGTFTTAYGTYSDIDGVIGTVYGTYTDMSDVTGTTWGIYCIGDQNNHLSGGLEVEGATRLGSATNNTGVDATGTVSFTGTARIGWTKIAANGVTFAGGPPSSGSALSAIQSHDGTLYTVDEDATNPGQNMVVDFTGVTAFNWVQIVAYYDGQASHHVEIQLEITPFNGSAWRSFGIMYPNGSHIENHSFFVPDDTDYINSGVVNIRFIHAESGNSNDDWVFDVVALYQ